MNPELKYYRSQLNEYSNKEIEELDDVYGSLIVSDSLSKKQKEALAYFYMKLHIMEESQIVREIYPTLKLDWIDESVPKNQTIIEVPVT